jgi:YfiH family protein
MTSGAFAAASAPVQLRTSALLSPVPHGFTDRHGGLCTGANATLSLQLNHMAERSQVRLNRQRVLDAMHCGARRWVCVKQIHGDQVVQVTAAASPHIEADALWTCDPTAVLAILVADCVPILMADATGRTVAAAHAGWRGTAARIAALTVQRLQAAAGVAPATLRAVLGPAIGPCCFVVGASTALTLRQAFPRAPTAAWRTAADGLYVDLWALNEAALVEAGVAPGNIQVVRRCTRCSDDLFSYRRDAGVTGRQAGVIALS